MLLIYEILSMVCFMCYIFVMLECLFSYFVFIPLLIWYKTYFIQYYKYTVPCNLALWCLGLCVFKCKQVLGVWFRLWSDPGRLDARLRPRLSARLHLWANGCRARRPWFWCPWWAPSTSTRQQSSSCLVWHRPVDSLYLWMEKHLLLLK